jgi:hypothetical protein
MSAGVCGLSALTHHKLGIVEGGSTNLGCWAGGVHVMKVDIDERPSLLDDSNYKVRRRTDSGLEKIMHTPCTVM